MAGGTGGVTHDHRNSARSRTPAEAPPSLDDRRRRVGRGVQLWGWLRHQLHILHIRTAAVAAYRRGRYFSEPRNQRTNPAWTTRSTTETTEPCGSAGRRRYGCARDDRLLRRQRRQSIPLSRSFRDT